MPLRQLHRIVLLALLCCLAAPTYAADLFGDLDGDGVLDGQDVCCNTPVGVTVDATGRPVGDLDLDCDVDLLDFAVLAANFTGPLPMVSCAPTCTDGLKNGNETDVDCGGGDCQPCPDWYMCQVPSDCIGMNCVAGICQGPSCSDGFKNGSETGVDCGGGMCLPCGPGQGCMEDFDCTSSVCVGGICQEPSCSDGVKNGSETGVDCGGSCPPCLLPDGSPCAFNADCESAFCVDSVCCNTACTSLCAACDVPGSPGICVLIPHGADPDNECPGTTTCNGAGGCTAALLPNGSVCSAGAECASNFCVDGVCCSSACSGQCQACNLTGSVGSCANIPNGLDPANECAGTSTCNGAGSCSP
jgi:hypothetical protein